MQQTIDLENAAFHSARWLNAPVYALPLDGCRLITGMVCAWYFVRTLLEARDVSDVHGLIDHELSFELFPFTRLTLFGANTTDFTFVLVFLLAVFCSFGLIFGYRPKVSAAALYVIAVSTYRWNFLVMYVDDAIVHLMLFWMLLLPIGRTLSIKDLVADRTGAWERWKCNLVPGGAARCFVMNIVLIYVVAGLWKWTSPMWREGTAVVAIMQLPVSYDYEAWNANHLWLFGPLNYLALVFEPLFPLLCLLRSGRLKYALGAAFITFHIFIIFTMKLPFANLLCLGAMCVLFRDELMRWLKGASNLEFDRAGNGKGAFGVSGILGIAVVVLLALAMLTSVSLPDWRQPVTKGSMVKEPRDEGLGSLQRPFFAILWAMGLAQQYQLLNWIDDRNYLVTYSIVESHKNGDSRRIDSTLMFPMDIRNVLLQSYMHGIVWTAVPDAMRGRLEDSLKRRYAARYCRRFDSNGEIHVISTIERITGKKPLRSAESQSVLMTFTCTRGESVLTN